MTINWQQFAEAIKPHRRVLITSHVRPDCDALGSELGLAALLEERGHEVTILNADAAPPHIAFIDPENRIRDCEKGVDDQLVSEQDALIVVDTSAWVQLGAMADVVRAFPGSKFVIDHHASQDDLGAATYKNTSAEATGRLIVELAQALAMPIPPRAADPLFAAIATDTGWFRFDSVNEETFRAIAVLVEAGASPSRLFGQLFEQNQLPRIHLQGAIMRDAQIECEGTLIYASVTAEMFAQTSAAKTDTEDVINRLLSISGTKCAVLFVELEPNFTKVSLRGRGGFNVRQVAEQFGGGGHTQAAGVSMDHPLEESRPQVLAALRKVLAC